MKNFKKISASLFLVILLLSNFASAQGRRSQSMTSDAPSKMTYDLSASSGSYNGVSYTELTLGLNWFLQDWLNWRNSIFSRQGSGIDSVQGLDSAARFSTAVVSEGGGFGFDAFAGPGVRMASKDNNAIFGEAGLIFRLGGLRIGGGVKALSYTSDRTDSTGGSLPKGDTQFFLILAGGGTL
jgi:hypothetical protein